MKKVLGIMGSPRKKNTNDLLDIFLEALDPEKYQVEKVYLSPLNIKHCTGCDYCGSRGVCIIKDDMDILYEHFDKSSLIVLAAPLYFNSFNGLSKNMIDRCQRYWSLKYSLGQNYKRGEDRQGILLSVGGAPFSHDQFNGNLPIADFFFKAINADYIGNYFVSNTDKVSIRDREDVKVELGKIGKNFSSKNSFYIQR